MYVGIHRKILCGKILELSAGLKNASDEELREYIQKKIVAEIVKTDVPQMYGGTISCTTEEIVAIIKDYLLRKH